MVVERWLFQHHPRSCTPFMRLATLGGMLKLVIFDFDGVIVDSEPLHHEAMRLALLDLGIDVGWDEYHDHYLTFDDRNAFGAALRRHGREPDEGAVRGLMERKSEAYVAALDTRLKVYPGAAELVRAAAARHPCGIGSGARKEEIVLILKKTGLLPFFHTIVSADDVTKGKPDPETFLKVVKRVSAARAGENGVIHPSEVLVIEDSPGGVQAAKSMRMKAVGVTNSYPAEKLLPADRVVATLEGFTIDDAEALFH